jgi:asparagine synthase (glutamine-hydrolysing)
MHSRDEDGPAFACVIADAPSTISQHVAVRQLRAMVPSEKMNLTQVRDCAIAVSGRGGPGSPEIAHVAGCVGVGTIRLDNRVATRELLRRHSIIAGDDVTDLELATQVMSRFGVDGARMLIGDFGFVVQNPSTGVTLAARDVFGVKPLFFARKNGLLLIASRADWLTMGGLDDLFLAHFLFDQQAVGSCTAYTDVTRLLHAHVAEWREGKCRLMRYWSPQEAPQVKETFTETRDEFRRLFAQAVEDRISNDNSSWAELSGGLDTSSIVAMASRLAIGKAAPLGGTLTYVDTLGEGDERPYVDALVSHTGVRNAQISNDWAWRDDGERPPLTDEPALHYPFFARQRRLYGIAAQQGATIMLGGHGADHYLQGTPDYISDHLRRGEISASLSAIRNIAVEQRSSFFQVAWACGISPFLPLRVRSATSTMHWRWPKWIEPKFARAFPTRDLLRSSDSAVEKTTTRFALASQRSLETIPSLFFGGLCQQGIDFRFPFLDRRLVEFSLGLPFHSIIRPGATKVILREAMTDILPELIRVRRTKGSIEARVIWSLNRERRRLDELLKAPILAELGCVQPAELRNAVDAARKGQLANTEYLLSTLVLETWLAVRAGRWEPSSNREEKLQRRPAQAGSIPATRIAAFHGE